MRLPNFLCVGAQKAGTTSLHAILEQHPDVYLPTIKETKFFQDASKYDKGIAYYCSEFFGAWAGQIAVGEIDPEYMYFDYVPKRIYEHLGNKIKLIFMLRNPVDRAYSHYWMSVRRGYETEAFEKAVEMERDRISVNEFYKNHFSYIHRGMYATQIMRFLRWFPLENMFFVVFEDDFLVDRPKTMKRMLQFLGVREDVHLRLDVHQNPATIPRSAIVRDLVYKRSLIKRVGRVFVPTRSLRARFLGWLDMWNQKVFEQPPVDEDLRKHLIDECFADEICMLEQIIGRSLRIWYPSPVGK